MSEWFNINNRYFLEMEYIEPLDLDAVLVEIFLEREEERNRMEATLCVLKDLNSDSTVVALLEKAIIDKGREMESVAIVVEELRLHEERRKHGLHG